MESFHGGNGHRSDGAREMASRERAADDLPHPRDIDTIAARDGFERLTIARNDIGHGITGDVEQKAV